MIKIINYQLSRLKRGSLASWRSNGPLAAILNARGQTLIEVLVALGVGVAVLVATTNAILSSLIGSDFGKNQSLSTQYAQQGMEVVRDLRNREGTNFFARSGSYCLPTDGPLTPGTCPSPNIDNFFTRKIIFDTLGAGRKRIAVTVSFADSKGTHQSNLISIFTDWNVQ